jgi:AraC family transcriptional regulator
MHAAMHAATPPEFTAVERLVFSSRRVKVAQWRCTPAFAEFRDTGPIRSQLVAFPRTSVRIRHVDGPEFVADPTVVSIYNRAQRYVREQLHPQGDFCDWWGVDDETAQDIAASVDASAHRARGGPFRFAVARSSHRLYLHQRSLLLRLSAGGMDELEAEEGVLGIVSEVLRSAAQGQGTTVAAAPGTSTRHRALAQSATAWLGVRHRENVALDDMARALSVSPFHLCRVFRAQTGATLHAHLTSVRLRTALECIEQGAHDLTQVALDAGFASHSHFGAAFRRAFGMTPSQWRMGTARSRTAAQPLARRR